MKGWKNILFPNFVVLQRGKDLTKTKFEPGKIPVASSTGIMGYHNKSFVKAPGITVGRSGSCGKVSYYEVDFWAHNTSLYVKDFKNNDELFSFYYLQFLDLGRFKTGASVPTLDRNILNTLSICIPPLPEQRKIAFVLCTVQKAIEQQDKLISTTTELKKALMQKLFTEGLHNEPQKMTEIGPVPESWEVVRLGTVAEIKMGQSPKGKTYNIKNVGVPLINGPVEFREIYPKAVQWTTKPTKICLPGDILFCVRGNTTGKMNFSDKEYCIGRGIAAIHGISDISTTSYLFWLLDYYRKNIYSIAVAGGSTFPNISKSNLNDILVPKPTLDQQEQISRYLSAVEEKIVHYGVKQRFLKSLFKTLLHELMTGQRRVHDLDFEGMIKEYKLTKKPQSMAAES